MSLTNYHSFYLEMSQRGLIQDITPDTEKALSTSKMTGYIGFDPTSDSLHVGSLAQIITLMRFQKAGHIPIVLVGGATGMIGDPSGKSQERNLLNKETLDYNIECIKKQLSMFLDFTAKDNSALLLNNYDWFKDISFIDFIRNVGKHISVSYMMAKDSVQTRLEKGISFTEFSYQLLQAYDFLYMNEHYNCSLQMGVADQWGNITTGTELIRKKTGKETYALTSPLIKKADGTKFGKTEGGNVWLDKNKTSPYKFYQFWLNTSDDDAKNYIKVFTFLSLDEINSLIQKHNTEPHLRHLQKELAKQITIMVHGEQDYQDSVKASEILFNGTMNDLAALPDSLFKDIMDGVPVSKITTQEASVGIDILEFLTTHTQIFPSKSEARKMLTANAVAINKEKVSDIKMTLSLNSFINNQFILIQKGKKNYYLCYLEK